MIFYELIKKKKNGKISKTAAALISHLPKAIKPIRVIFP